MNNNTEWQTVHYYNACLEAAERCGFTLEQADDHNIRILTNNPPYVEGTCIKWINGFYATLCWLQGYEQRIFEVKNT